MVWMEWLLALTCGFKLLRRYQFQLLTCGAMWVFLLTYLVQWFISLIFMIQCYNCCQSKRSCDNFSWNVVGGSEKGGHVTLGDTWRITKMILITMAHRLQYNNQKTICLVELATQGSHDIVNYIMVSPEKEVAIRKPWECTNCLSKKSLEYTIWVLPIH